MNILRGFVVLAAVSVSALGAEPPRELVRVLRDGGAPAQERARAAEALGHLGDAARPAIPVLIKALRDEGGQVRGRAAVALWRLDASLETVLPALLAARHSPDEGVRAEADAAWRRIGQGTRAALPYLMQQFRNNGPQSQSQSQSQSQDKMAAALGQEGLAAVPALIDALALEHNHPIVRMGAGMVTMEGATTVSTGTIPPPTPFAIRYLPSGDVRLLSANGRIHNLAVAALGRLGASVVPTLIEALKDPNAFVREGAAEALGRVGSEASPAASTLIDVLDDRAALVRLQAIEALGKIGKPVAEVRPALIAAIEHKDPLVRRGAVHALGDPELHSPETTAALVRALDDPDALARFQAADLLARYDPPVAASLPVLVEALEDHELRQLRPTAGTLLENLGPRARAVVPALRQLAQAGAGDPETRVLAARVLGRIGPDERASALDVLRGLIDGDDLAARIVAAAALWDLGEPGPAIPVMIAALSSGDNNLSNQASQFLQRLGPENRAAVPALIEALRDCPPNARFQILSHLQRLGTAARDAIPIVVPLLTDPDANVRQYAISTLNQVGRLPGGVLPDLIAALKQPDANIRIQVVQLISKMGAEAKEAIPTLTAMLKDPRRDTRMQAIQALRQIGSRDVQATAAALVAAMTDDDQTIRTQAAQALGSLSGLPDETAPALVALLGDKRADVRSGAAQALGRMGPRGAKAALPVLTEALKQDNLDPAHRLDALQALVPIVSVERDALRTLGPVLIKLLKDQRADVRTQTIQVLKQAGSSMDQETRIALGAALKDDDPGIRFEAARALVFRSGTPEGDEAVRVLIAALASSEPKQRSEAATTLGQVGTRAVDAVPALTKLLDDPDTAIRKQAVQALSRLGPKGVEAAMPSLVEALRSSDFSARMQAASALSQSGRAGTEAAAAALVEMLGDSDSRVRSQAIQLLGQMSPAPRKAIAALVKLLKDPDPRFRSQVVRELARLGPEATKAAAPVLIEALREGSHSDRIQALQSLQHFPAAGLKAAIPAVVALLDDSQPNVRYQAVGLLSYAGADMSPARDVLAEMLRDVLPQNRITAAQAIAKAKPKLGTDLTGTALAAMVAIVKDPRHQSHLAAAQALALMGPEGERTALPVLSAMLRGGQQYQQIQAIDSLKAMSPDLVKDAVPAMIEALGDGDPFVRSRVAATLGELGPDTARPAIPALVEALKDGEPTSSSAIVESLARLGPEGLQPLISALELREGPPRAAIVAAIGRVGPAARPAIPALLAILGDGKTDEPLRRAVFQTLGEIGPIAEPDQLRRLRDPNLAVRIAVAQVLIEGRDDPATLPQDDLIPVLAEALRSDQVEHRRTGAALAARFKEPPPALVLILEKVLDDEDGLVRVRAAHALGKLADPPPRVILQLIAAVDDPALRSAAIDALEALGPTAKRALLALAGVLKNGAEPNDMIRTAYALARIGGAEAVEPLLGTLDVIESSYRPLVVEALDQTGPDGPKVLRRLLDHDDPAVRAMAVRHLGLRSSGRAELKEVLDTVLADRDREVKIAALQALSQAGGDAKSVVPRLVTLRDSDDATIAAEAAVALFWIEGTVAEPSLPVLRAAARDRNHPSRWRVVDVLGRAGPPAIPTLIESLRDITPVRLKAAEALGRIGPPAADAIPALLAARTTNDAPLRAEIALALWKINHQAEPVLPMLLDALQSPSLSPQRHGVAVPVFPSPHTMVRKYSFGRPGATSLHLSVVYPGGHSQFVPLLDLITLRRRMIEALGEIGPPARAALPLLSEAATSQDEDPEVRNAASESRKRVGIEEKEEDQPPRRQDQKGKRGWMGI